MKNDEISFDDCFTIHTNHKRDRLREIQTKYGLLFFIDENNDSNYCKNEHFNKEFLSITTSYNSYDEYCSDKYYAIQCAIEGKEIPTDVDLRLLKTRTELENAKATDKFALMYE